MSLKGLKEEVSTTIGLLCGMKAVAKTNEHDEGIDLFLLRLHINQTKAGTYIHRQKYNKELSKKFEMNGAKTSSTPSVTTTTLDRDEVGVSVAKIKY